MRVLGSAVLLLALAVVNSGSLRLNGNQGKINLTDTVVLNSNGDGGQFQTSTLKVWGNRQEYQFDRNVENGSDDGSDVGDEDNKKDVRDENNDNDVDDTGDVDENDDENIMNDNGMLYVPNNDNFFFKKIIKAMLSFTWQQWSELPLEKNSSQSSQCLADIKRIKKAVKAGEAWPVPFVDSSGKPGASMFVGWLDWIGSYDQCQDAVAPPTSNASSGFKGQYCVLSFLKGVDVFDGEMSICFPSTCSERDLNAMAEVIASSHRLNISVHRLECRNGDTDVTAATVCCVIVLSLLTSMIVAGTIYDVFFVQNIFSVWDKNPRSTDRKLNTDAKPQEEEALGCHQSSSTKNYQTLIEEHTLNGHGFSKSDNGDKKDESVQDTKTNALLRFLAVFSVYSNGKKLLTVQDSPQSVGSLHGLRYLSIAWVIFGHVYYFTTTYGINDLGSLSNNVQHESYQPASNAFLSVDTFFMLSGFLTSYLTLLEMDKKGWRLNWALFYFHRFWRLTPPYMLVILTSLGLTQYLGGGALWSKEQPRDKEYCENDWWKNLLYINNFYSPTKTCMYHSWYLANDMQFFILSPLMIIPFHFHYLAGFGSCLGFLLTSWTATGVQSTVNDWLTTQITVRVSLEDRLQWEEDYYVKPWCRIGPFVIGVIAGYLLTQTKGKSIRVKSWVVVVGWMASAAVALSAVYGLYGDTSGKHPSSTGVAALYNSVGRSAWAVAIAWIILACDAGYGGPVNAILSWSPFVVLGRLTYMTYLLHPYIMYIFLDNLELPFYSSDTSLSMYFIGFLVFCNFAAFFFVLAFESPMLGLEKLLLKKQRK